MTRKLRMFQRMVFQNKLFTMILIFEACLTFFTVSASLNRYGDDETYLNYYEARPILATSIVRFETVGLEKDQQESWMNLVQETEGYKGRARIYSAEIMAGDEAATLRVYDPMTAKIFFPTLLQGDYPNSFSGELGEVISIGSSQRGAKADKIGEEIPFQLANEEQGPYPHFPKRMKVKGIASYYDTELLRDGSSLFSGEDTDLKVIFSDKKTYGKHYLAVEPEVQDNSQAFQLYYFDDRLSPEKRDDLVEKGEEMAPTYAIAKLRKGTDDVLINRLNNDIPFNIVVALIFLSGLITTSILNVKKLLPQFQVYRLCGASRRTCLMMYFWASLLLFFFCIIIHIIHMYISFHLSNSVKGTIFLLRGQRIIFLIALSVVQAALMTVPMALFIKKEIQ